MAIEIRIPRLGWSMEEGTFVGWLRKDGDVIQPGQPLYELEGEKAQQEIESVDAGILRIPPDAPKPESTVLVGALLGYLVAEGEPAPWERPEESPAVWHDAPRREAVSVGDETSVVCSEPPKNHDAERRATLPAARDRAVSTPRARRVARELGVDWTDLLGTGRCGRIRESDVRAVAGRANGDVITLSPRRRAISERLRAGSSHAIPVTLTTTADVTELVHLRNRFKATNTEVVPAYTDLVACLVVPALKQHRILAARWIEDGRTLALPPDDGFHIGIAIDTPDGLLVAVVRDVASSTLTDVARLSRELAEKARAGRLSAAEMQGSVFTISNLGAFGIDAFTPVINHPETAILGLGAIRRVPVFVAGGHLEARDQMTLSLTFDHRAVDGAPAAAFLRDLRIAIESPASLSNAQP